MRSVSIVIPTRNRCAELREALDSLRQQTFVDWEAVVVDDHSTEDVRSVVKGLDGRIAYVRLPDGTGGGQAARNAGVEATTAPLIVFFDSDDYLSADALETRVRLMDGRPGIDFLVTSCGIFETVPGDTPLLWNELRPDDTPDDDLDRYLVRDVVWQTSSPTWRRVSWPRVGPWDETLPLAQDWEQHIRAIARGLSYEKVSVVDHYWRRPAADRSTIGMWSFSPEGVRARPLSIARALDTLQSAGKLTPRRRRMIAGLYLECADRLARRVSRREARDTWWELRKLKLVGGVSHRLAWWYLFLLRWPDLATWWRQKMYRWVPGELLLGPSATFMKTHHPPLPASAAAP